MLTSKQAVNISKVLSNEEEKIIATLTGQVSPGKSMAMSLVMQAETDSGELTACVQEFLRELITLAADNGIPLDAEEVKA